MIFLSLKLLGVTSRYSSVGTGLPSTMFQKVPSGDAILMKWILHDWSDEHCATLLKNCYDALPAHGKVVLVECILPVNPEATLIFYQPPAISYELRGKMEIYDETETGKREIYQQFINAQHDVYHFPDMSRWLTRPAYIFRIEEIYDNCVTKDGFGEKMLYPY